MGPKFNQKEFITQIRKGYASFSDFNCEAGSTSFFFLFFLSVLYNRAARADAAGYYGSEQNDSKSNAPFFNSFCRSFEKFLKD